MRECLLNSLAGIAIAMQVINDNDQEEIKKDFFNIENSGLSWIYKNGIISLEPEYYF